ncbi:hypothetical protein BDV93DRAFT_510742 [Ceratobasidium sp. AG-I]|nr:hypothetical protein BDV93DRAFT_510742 [Ceratobasidium sp. AG-I]
MTFVEKVREYPRNSGFRRAGAGAEGQQDLIDHQLCVELHAHPGDSCVRKHWGQMRQIGCNLPLGCVNASNWPDLPFAWKFAIGWFPDVDSRLGSSKLGSSTGRGCLIVQRTINKSSQSHTHAKTGRSEHYADKNSHRLKTGPHIEHTLKVFCKVVHSLHNTWTIHGRLVALHREFYSHLLLMASDMDWTYGLWNKGWGAVLEAEIPLLACGNRASRPLLALALAPAHGNAGIPGNPANARGIAEKIVKPFECVKYI